MNIHGKVDMPDTDDAKAALETLRLWAASATPSEVAKLDPAISRLLPERPLGNYPDLTRQYDADFKVDAAYKASLPDLQNGPASLIVGARKRIEHVGISNFRLPLRLRDLILLAVGWWQYQDGINDYTRLLLGRILHRTRLHSVRDAYTARDPAARIAVIVAL